MTVSDYHVRVSARAKRVQLRVKPTGDVELILPKGVNPKHADTFVQDNQAWIKRTQQRLEARRATQPNTDNWPPEKIIFPSFEQIWEVQHSQLNRLSCKAPVIWLPQCEIEKQKEQLNNWIRKQAQNLLVPRLTQLSEELSLPFNRAVIRRQKTRWGSCSSRGTISLNCNLIFLSTELVRYLMIHELCHTKQMNHSSRFWQLVAQHEPNYRYLDTELSKAPAQIPRWALPV